MGSGDQYRVLSFGTPPVFGAIKAPAKAYGGFLTGASELTERIDFTQHCLDAYLVWNTFEK